jgi:hypothetical protein
LGYFFGDILTKLSGHPVGNFTQLTRQAERGRKFAQTNTKNVEKGTLCPVLTGGQRKVLSKSLTCHEINKRLALRKEEEGVTL